MARAVERSGARRRADRGADGWLPALAADLHTSTRVATRLRPDGLVEVTAGGVVLGFVDHVAPVFVALAGERPCIAVEVAQRHSLAAAVDALRAAVD